MTFRYFNDDPSRPYLLVLPTARRSRGKSRWLLAAYWEGAWAEGRQQAIGGGHTPWRLLLEKVTWVEARGEGRRPRSRSRFRLEMDDHVLLLPAARPTPLTDSSSMLKLVGLEPDGPAAVERARSMGHSVLVARVAIIGHDDYGASRAVVFDGIDGTTRFEGGVVEV